MPSESKSGDDSWPNADVFVHATALERAGVDQLLEGQKVSFTTEEDSRSGKMAVATIEIE